jgi:hypothetical protein
VAISLSSLTRAKVRKPPRILLYGVAGVGKSTFGAGAPAPVFIPIEDGTPLDVDAFPLAKTFDDVMQALGALYTEEHQHKTLVIDTLDWLEPLVWTEACKRNGWRAIEDPGYGKGYVAALSIWREYIEGLNALRDGYDDRPGMTIIQLAHAKIQRFDSPETEPYDRYEIKLHKGAAALLSEHSDAILFANYRVSTIKSDVGFNKKVVRGAGSSERLLHTVERPAYIAKNRFHLPETLPLSWEEFQRALDNHPAK